METQQQTAYIGIDPGMNGAIAVIWPNGTIDFQAINGSLNDGIDFLRNLHGQGMMMDCDCYDYAAVIEKVGAMPKQGIASTAKFMYAYGHLRGALIALGIPIIAEPTPQVWKRAMSIKGKTRADQKTAARNKARELYPETADELRRVCDADKAEALLMAEHGRRGRG